MHLAMEMLLVGSGAITSQSLETLSYPEFDCPVLLRNLLSSNPPAA
jgi:hypothetical protein